MATFDKYTPDSNPDLTNPERGMYSSKLGKPNFGVETPPDKANFHTIFPEWLWLAPWCNKDLVWDGYHPDNQNQTSPVLNEYAKTLEDARSGGYKILFRPRYDDGPDEDGEVRNDCNYLINGGPNGPPVFHAVSLEQQKNHIDAVAAMLGDYKDVIAFIQAGYLGNWGEWNTGGDDEEGNPYTPANAPLLYTRPDRSAILDHILFAYAEAGIEQDVELRTPVFAKEVVERWKNHPEIYGQDAKPNVGLHNDCFMSSENISNEEWPKISGHDTGTYLHFFDFLTFSDLTASSDQQNLSTEPGIDLETVEDARKCAEELTENSSFGGETCPNSDHPEEERWRSCTIMTDPNGDPAQLHLCYLNHDYYSADEIFIAVEEWQNGGCYDEIRCRLGYRFEVTSVEYTETVAASQNYQVNIHVRNVGWAKLHKPRDAKLVLRNGATKQVRDFDVGGDVETWGPGETKLSITTQAPNTPGMYSVRLWIPDPDLLALLEKEEGVNPEEEDPEGYPEAQINYAVKLASKRTDDNGDIVNVFDQTTGENDLGVKIEVQ